MKVEITRDISASGQDEGHSLTIRKHSHGWSKGELSREELLQIAETITKYLAQPDLGWLFMQPLYLTPVGPAATDGVLVQNIHRTHAVILAVVDDRVAPDDITANGIPFEFGRDMPRILALLEGAVELGPGEHLSGLV